MSGFRRKRPPGYVGHFPARLKPISKSKKYLESQKQLASQYSYSLGLSTPEASMAEESFDDSFDERGDAPAQAIMVRNARTLAQRLADETKEELAIVLDRVEQVSGKF